MIRIHGVQHIGLTVPNMQEAVDFFTQVLGAETIMECGSIDADDEFMHAHLGVLPGCRIKDQRVLQIGKGGALELFEYEGAANSPIKNNAEVGAMHIAFEVDDAFASAEELKKAGVDLLKGPTLIEDGPMEGLVWLYFRSPWGQYLEIVSWSAPLGYERQGGPKMYSPKT